MVKFHSTENSDLTLWFAFSEQFGACILILKIYTHVWCVGMSVATIQHSMQIKFSLNVIDSMANYHARQALNVLELTKPDFIHSSCALVSLYAQCGFEIKSHPCTEWMNESFLYFRYILLLYSLLGYLLMQMLQFSTLFHSHFSPSFPLFDRFARPQWGKINVCTEPQKAGQHKCINTTETLHNFHLHTNINECAHTRVCVRSVTESHDYPSSNQIYRRQRV